MLDKLYILIALIVGICITIVMIVNDFSAVQWANTTFWLMVGYLFVGLILRNYLKKKVFNEVETEIPEAEVVEPIETIEEEEKFIVDDVERAFFDDDDDE